MISFDIYLIVCNNVWEDVINHINENVGGHSRKLVMDHVWDIRNIPIPPMIIIDNMRDYDIGR